MFNALVDKVCEVCEIRKDLLINGSKLQSVVDGRILLVQYLRRIGLSSDDIALLTLREAAGDYELCPSIQDLKKKSRVISRIFNSYSERCLQSYSFSLMSVEISKFCQSEYEEQFLTWMKILPK